MLNIRIPAAEQKKTWHIIVIILIILETILVASALIPEQVWARLLSQSANASLDSPYPLSIGPGIIIFLYLLPAIIGFLCRDWQRALLYAIFPLWVGLGVFLVLGSAKIGIFYLVTSEHIGANINLLELFASLGILGWLARNLFKPLGS
ncbi:MAG: hypothetical protein H0V70_09090 [Ktedonobacteraceae bacterium]|nr:hypothetical protein [Ktedonobacteraceae bacterium]